MKPIFNMTIRALAPAAVAAGAALFFQPAAHAQTIIDEWTAVQTPAAPTLKQVKIDPQTTALLVLDILKQSCNAERRPRCVASVPKIAKLLEDARARNVTVIHSRYPGPKPEDALPETAHKGNEPSIVGLSDKFIGTDLEKMLKDKNIKTVVVVSVAAHGAILFTAGAAAMRGFDVVVPIDGMTAENTYAEQAAAWLLANAPTVGNKMSLTRMDMIGY